LLTPEVIPNEAVLQAERGISYNSSSRFGRSLDPLEAAARNPTAAQSNDPSIMQKARTDE